MGKGIPLAIAVLLVVGSTAASAQQPVDPAATIDTVEVTAQREALRKAIYTFVANVTRFGGENVARWRFPICPAVAGVAREQGEFLRARVVEIAALVGAPLARDQKKCAPNLFVVLTPQPEQLWAAYKQRNPKMFATLQPQRVERSLSTKPVQVVQNAVLNNADGTVPSDSSNYRLRGSRISSSVTEDITSVIVVVNDAQTGGATFGQLADYVAMVALAGSDLSADYANASSILRLFATSDAGTPPPARLTDWDQAYLKALYRNDSSNARLRSVIATDMAQAIVP